MRAVIWIAGLLAATVVEILLAGALFIMANEENCDNGVARWSCSGSLEALIAVAFIAVPIVTLVAILLALRAAWKR